MIECSYILHRDEGDITREFCSRKDMETLPNLVYIEGPNSSGKSTLLNILALSLFGLHKENINPSLRNKMQSLISSNHQQLKFNVKISNKDGSLTIESLKENSGNPEIILYETKNGQRNILSWERFHSEYNLIYDIPDNPTERLKQLVNEIKITQKNYGNRLEELRQYLIGVKSEIEKSKNQDLINELERKISAQEKKVNESHNELIINKKVLRIIEKYTYSKYYVEYLNAYNTYKKSLESQNKKIKSEKSKNNRLNKNFHNINQEFNKEMDNLEDLFYNTSSLIKSFIPDEEKYFLEYWDKIDFNKVRRVYKFDESFKKLILTFCSIIDNIKKEKEEDSNDLKLYRELIKFLEKYKELDIVIPGLDKSIPEFIEILSNTNKENQSKLVHLENVTNTLNCLVSLNEKREDIESKYLRKLVKMKEESSKTDASEDELSYDPQIVDQNIKNLKSKIENVTKKLNYYLAEFLKIGYNQEELLGVYEEMGELPEVESYKFYTEDNLLQQIKDLKDQILNQKNEYETEKKFLGLFQADYSREKEKKPHIYQEQLSRITGLINLTKNLVVKINKDYDLYISKIIDPNGITIKKELQEDFNNYCQILFNFLGNKIDTIRHIDSEYKVDSIDLIKGIIKTKEGKTIRLSDMGTGQSQSAYLTGLLNTFDNKKIIALFDEVAMMDDTSMEPIYTKFRELYENNKLLVGIVVQMANEINISDIRDKYATRT